MDLDEEDSDDTFLATGNVNDTVQLAAKARHDTGIRGGRSFSPLGSATIDEELIWTSAHAPRTSKKAKIRGSSRSVVNSSQALKIHMKAMKETMKLINPR